MATIIRRIVSRGQLLAMVSADDKSKMYDHQFDMTAHMLADGKTVKIYYHSKVGSTVVEYDPDEL